MYETLYRIFVFLFFSGNMIRGLDADECDFLSGVENLKAKQDLEKNKVNCFEFSHLRYWILFGDHVFQLVPSIFQDFFLSAEESFGETVNRKYWKTCKFKIIY